MRGIYLGDWYNNPIAPLKQPLKISFYQKNSCPNAERAVKITVNLPTHINISIDEAKEIIEIIKNFERKNNT